MIRLAAALAALLRDRLDLGQIEDAHLQEVIRREHMDRPFVTPPCGVRAPKVLRRVQRPHWWRQDP